MPLLRGGDAPDTLLGAVRKLDALSRPQSQDAMATLLDLASERYDRATFWNVLGEDRIMQSWLWQMGRDEGEAKGEARAVRRICVDLSKECHPRVAARVLPAIEACDEPETLRAWVMQCPKLSDAEYVALVTGQPHASITRSRTSRPSRASHPAGHARK